MRENSNISAYRQVPPEGLFAELVAGAMQEVYRLHEFGLGLDRAEAVEFHLPEYSDMAAFVLFSGGTRTADRERGFP